MSLSLIVIPIVAAFIGWFTNWLAIKMLFHPHTPRSILGIRFHGVLPKRQKDLARKVGQVVAEELVSAKDISDAIANNLTADDLAKILDERLEHVLSVTLPGRLPIVSNFVRSELAREVRKILLGSAGEVIAPIVTSVGSKLTNSLNVQQIVEDKVAKYSSAELERVLVTVMRRELRFVELIGGILGFVVGLLQVFIIRL